MAKAKNTATPAADESGTAAPDGTVGIKIQGHIFHFTPRYAEGHVLSAVEADVLNQTFGENLRNNFASRMRDAAEAIAKETPAGASPRAFTEDELAKFASDFAEYSAAYTFKAPRVGSGPVDPVAAESNKIAKAIIMAHLQKKNIKVSTLPEGKIAELVEALQKKNPGIREEAVRRVEALKSAGDSALDDLVA